MKQSAYHTPGGDDVSAVTADEMAAVDRVAVDEFHIGLLQMMEHAGRNLAWHVRSVASGSVCILAGSGGNGGGGLAAGRHLVNRDVPVSVVLDRHPDELDGATRRQHDTLRRMGVPIDYGVEALEARNPDLVVDALVGYGLDGPLRGTTGELVEAVNSHDTQVVSLDVPSGRNATTGGQPGVAVQPIRLVTLALPKTGLLRLETDLYLADIGIPAGVYESLELPYSNPFDEHYWVSLSQTCEDPCCVEK